MFVLDKLLFPSLSAARECVTDPHSADRAVAWLHADVPGLLGVQDRHLDFPDILLRHPNLVEQRWGISCVDNADTASGGKLPPPGSTIGASRCRRRIASEDLSTDEWSDGDPQAVGRAVFVNWRQWH